MAAAALFLALGRSTWPEELERLTGHTSDALCASGGVDMLEAEAKGGSKRERERRLTAECTLLWQQWALSPRTAPPNKAKRHKIAWPSFE